MICDDEDELEDDHDQNIDGDDDGKEDAVHHVDQLQLFFRLF